MFLDCLFIFWFLLNFVATFVIIISCLSATEFDKLSVLLYPILVFELREKLNIAGTVIVTVLFSIFFLPAIIVYFIILLILAVAYLIVKCFIKIFGRKN